ncbi:MAG: hypothetical protein JW847_08760 [Candidatus Omnitrophica bacterium]|nr:hypothetical protein [Candidatus Omnitrophota bacterium]
MNAILRLLKNIISVRKAFEDIVAIARTGSLSSSDAGLLNGFAASFTRSKMDLPVEDRLHKYFGQHEVTMNSPVKERHYIVLPGYRCFLV